MISEEKLLARTLGGKLLWSGFTWREAIEGSLERNGCDVEAITEFTSNNLLDPKTRFVGYALVAWEGERTLHRRIPKTLNEFTLRKLQEHTRKETCDAATARSRQR